MALDKDTFSPVAFRKVQKMSNIGFFTGSRFTTLGKDRKNHPSMSVSLFSFYTRERAFTSFFFSSIYAQVLSVRITPMY